VFFFGRDAKYCSCLIKKFGASCRC